MKLIKHKTLERTWLIAESDDDAKVLEHLYTESICWGLYSLWTETPTQKLVMTETSQRIPDIPDEQDNALLKHFKTEYPDMKALGFISHPKNYMTMEE